MYIMYEFRIQLRSALFDNKSYLTIHVTKPRECKAIEAFRDIIDRVSTCELKEDEIVEQVILRSRRLLDSCGQILAIYRFDTRD